VYTESQALKRREKLLERLMKKAEENGVPFVPESGGPLEELWIEKGYGKSKPHIPGLNPDIRLLKSDSIDE